MQVSQDSCKIADAGCAAAQSSVRSEPVGLSVNPVVPGPVLAEAQSAVPVLPPDGVPGSSQGSVPNEPYYDSVVIAKEIKSVTKLHNEMEAEFAIYRSSDREIALRFCFDISFCANMLT